MLIQKKVQIKIVYVNFIFCYSFFSIYFSFIFQLKLKVIYGYWNKKALELQRVFNDNYNPIKYDMNQYNTKIQIQF